MRKPRILLMSIGLLLLTALPGACIRQRILLAEDDELLLGMAEDRRARLEARLSEFVELHVQERWEGVYDMLCQLFLSTIASGVTREEWIRSRQSWGSDFVRFKVHACYLAQGVPWMVDPGFVDEGGPQDGLILVGCGLFKSGLSMEQYKTEIYATWEAGDWYFSTPQLTFPGCDPIPEPCGDYSYP